MNLRRLQYFVKIVDVGSLTQAADILHVAQPALSQQLATLEGEVRQQLLLRTKRGVIPTEAGKVLYRHAQLILRQCEQAKSDMNAAGQRLAGAVSVGLAPGTAAAGLALPLLRTVRTRHPDIVLYLAETYGTTLSELVMSGRMDLAVLYGGGTPVHGLAFSTLLRERLCLVGPQTTETPPASIPLRQIVGMDLYLPRPYNVVRKMVDDACAGIGIEPQVVAEIESAGTLISVIAAGLGATILPEVDGPPSGRVLRILAVADRRALNRSTLGALPIRPSAALGACPGGQGHPAGARLGHSGQPACKCRRASFISRSYLLTSKRSWRAEFRAGSLGSGRSPAPAG